MARIPITDDIHDELVRLKTRAGHGAVSTISRHPDAPEALTAQMIFGWLSRDTKTAAADCLQFVLEGWRSAPGRVPITGCIREKLNGERRRTGYGSHRLLAAIGDTPQGLTPPLIDSWMDGGIATAKEDNLELVLSTFAKLPNIPAPIEDARQARGLHAGKEALSRRTLRELKALRDKSGIGPNALFSGRSDVPAGLSPALVAAWLSGRIKSATHEHLAYVERIWSEATPRIAITPEIRSEMKALRDRTGLGEQALLYGRKDKPKGLNANKIRHWLEGGASWADSDELAYVMTLWRQESPLLQITEQQSTDLRREAERCGLNWVEVHRHLPDMRHRPSTTTLRAWAKGGCRVRVNVFDAVLDWLKRQPSKEDVDPLHALSSPSASSRVALTAEIRNHLKAERARTGYGWRALLNRLAPCPEGLTPGLLSRWAGGGARSAKRDELTFILEGLKSIPDAAKK